MLEIRGGVDLPRLQGSLPPEWRGTLTPFIAPLSFGNNLHWIADVGNANYINRTLSSHSVVTFSPLA